MRLPARANSSGLAPAARRCATARARRLHRRLLRVTRAGACRPSAQALALGAAFLRLFEFELALRQLRAEIDRPSDGTATTGRRVRTGTWRLEVRPTDRATRARERGDWNPRTSMSCSACTLCSTRSSSRRACFWPPHCWLGRSSPGLPLQRREGTACAELPRPHRTCRHDGFLQQGGTEKEHDQLGSIAYALVILASLIVALTSLGLTFARRPARPRAAVRTALLVALFRPCWCFGSFFARFAGNAVHGCCAARDRRRGAARPLHAVRRDRLRRASAVTTWRSTTGSSSRTS